MDNEIKMFGCRKDQLEALLVRDDARAMCMVVMSQLSDAQEQIALGLSEDARQTINRAKYLLLEAFHPDKP